MSNLERLTKSVFYVAPKWFYVLNGTGSLQSIKYRCHKTSLWFIPGNVISNSGKLDIQLSSDWWGWGFLKRYYSDNRGRFFVPVAVVVIACLFVFRFFFHFKRIKFEISTVSRINDFFQPHPEKNICLSWYAYHLELSDELCVLRDFWVFCHVTRENMLLDSANKHFEPVTTYNIRK